MFILCGVIYVCFNCLYIDMCVIQVFSCVKQYFAQMQRKQRLQYKLQRKMKLREHSQIKPLKFVEYDQEQEEKQIQSKSRRWWQKIDRKYFQTTSKQQLLCLQTTIMEDYCIMTELVPYRQQSYFHMNLFSRHPRLFDKGSIKVLFLNDKANDGCGDSFFITYKFGLKAENQHEEQSKEEQGKGDQRYDDQGYDQEYDDQGQVLNLISLQSIEQQHTTYPVTCMKKLHTQQNQNNKHLITQPQQVSHITKKLQLKCTKSLNDIDFLTQCNFYDIANSQYYRSQIDREIDLWNNQLLKVQSLNQIAWTHFHHNLEQQITSQTQSNITNQSNITTQSNIKTQLKQGYNLQQDITNIHQALTWKHNLVNLKMGFSDKNQEMLAETLQGMWIKEHKTNNMGEKKKFFKASLQNLMQTKSELSNIIQTDCKVCFSTYVSDKNKVIYCDHCNESFHEKCYGIEDLNEDPNSKFYCDACQYLMDPTNKKTQMDPTSKKTHIVPACQICFVAFSPLKRIGSQFFHPSCLFLNNLLKPKLGNLQLQEQLTPQIIIQYIKEFQQSNQVNQCEYCTQKCKSGLRFKCSQPQCSRHFHTLCAYLNACEFSMWRNNEKMQTEIKCWQHCPKRDNVRQAYLRRFFCNYKNTSDLSQSEFIQIYNEQLSSVQEFKLEIKNNKIKTEGEKIKVRRKTNKKSKQQVNSSTSVIDLNFEEDMENTTQNNRQSPLKRSHKTHLKTHQQNTELALQQHQVDIDQLSRKISAMSQNNKSHAVPSQTLSTYQAYLSTVHMDQNSDLDSLKEDYPFSPKEDCPYLTESNTNSNDLLDTLSKKIVSE